MQSVCCDATISRNYLEHRTFPPASSQCLSSLSPVSATLLSRQGRPECSLAISPLHSVPHPVLGGLGCLGGSCHNRRLMPSTSCPQPSALQAWPDLDQQQCSALCLLPSHQPPCPCLVRGFLGNDGWSQHTFNVPCTSLHDLMTTHSPILGFRRPGP